MPGLVGATFRRKSELACFRDSITHSEGDKKVSPSKGVVIVKLLNLILRELDNFFLNQGIWIQKNVIESFFNDQSKKMNLSCKSVFNNDRVFDVCYLNKLIRKHGNNLIFIKIVR